MFSYNTNYVLTNEVSYTPTPDEVLRFYDDELELSRLDRSGGLALQPGRDLSFRNPPRAAQRTMEPRCSSSSSNGWALPFWWPSPSRFISFSLLFLSGDPAAALAGETASGEDIEAIRALYGFDRPMLVQYVDWLSSALPAISARATISSCRSPR